MKTNVKFSTFEVSDYLDNEVVIAEYLTLAENEGNPELFIMAKADVEKARLMKKVKIQK